MLNKKLILQFTDKNKSYSFKICFVILLFILFANNLHGQNYNEFETGFSTIFNHGFKLDPYYFGNNPAYLNFTNSDEFLSLKNITKNSEGEFKKFIAPQTDRSFGFFASGKKSIDSTQKFKGSFGFSKLVRKNWDWFFARDYDADNPFIIGDSTSGNSRINGILINAQYAISILDNLTAGVNLDYTVDEGLKTVSPRPTSECRNIAATLGIGYAIDKKMSVGVIAYFSDNNEQITYREDEGALTQETIILKFKGYDFPNIVRKKVETRYSYTNNYATGINFSYNDRQQFNLTGYINTGFEKTTILDDALDPKGEGFWKDEFLTAGFKTSLKFGEGIHSGFVYNCLLRKGWAEYPPTNVLYFERNDYTHSFMIGLEKMVTDNLSAGIESGILFSSRAENDHYSQVKTKSEFNHWSGKVGVDYKWFDIYSTLISYGFSKKSNSSNELLYQSNSIYFTNYRIKDLLFQQTGFSTHTVSVTSELKSTGLGDLLFQINYSVLVPESDSIFANRKRNDLEFTLEYRVKAF